MMMRVDLMELITNPSLAVQERCLQTQKRFHDQLSKECGFGHMRR